AMGAQSRAEFAASVPRSFIAHRAPRTAHPYGGGSSGSHEPGRGDGRHDTGLKPATSPALCYPVHSSYPTQSDARRHGADVGRMDLWAGKKKESHHGINTHLDDASDQPRI
ncbi:hypothetical protein V493_08050, partial [Pseudogymnoascus sp. VKM F-4281 (FW-2241)]